MLSGNPASNSGIPPATLHLPYLFSFLCDLEVKDLQSFQFIELSLTSTTPGLPHDVVPLY
jgi:hypothetical protein